MDKKKREITDLRELPELTQNNTQAKVETNLQGARELAGTDNERKKQYDMTDTWKKQGSEGKTGLRESNQWSRGASGILAQPTATNM